MDQMIDTHFPSLRRARPGAAAFSLIEVLVVLGVISIVAVLTLPTLNSAFTSAKINSATQMIADTIALARQEAVAKDRYVQVRFYKITTGTQQGWRAIQVFRMEPNSGGSTTVAVTRLQTLPDGIILSPTLSPLLTADSAISGTDTLPIYGSTSYGGFCFLPSGETENSLTAQNNYITVQNATSPGAPPSNYSTLQVNLVTGKVITYRP